MSAAEGWSDALGSGAKRRSQGRRDDEREFGPALRAIERARRLAPQLRLLGRVHSLLGGAALSAALVLSVLLTSAVLFAGGPSPEWLAIGGAVAFALALFGAPWLALGFGLHRRRSWARGLGVVLGALLLPFAPLGTALGIWTLVIVLSWRPDLARAAGE
jgi:hypothetical protein